MVMQLIMYRVDWEVESPICDTDDRTYLYALNNAITISQPQSIHFIPSEGILLIVARNEQFMCPFHY